MRDPDHDMIDIAIGGALLAVTVWAFLLMMGVL